MPIALRFDIASRALLSQQLGADTISHNIANVSSDGYSRQRLLRLEAPPGPVTPYWSGPGPDREEVMVQRLISQIEDADFAESLAQMQLRETAYQAALGAAGRPLNLCLLDFLR